MCPVFREGVVVEYERTLKGKLGFWSSTVWRYVSVGKTKAIPAFI